MIVYDYVTGVFVKRNDPAVLPKSPSALLPSIGISSNGRLVILGSYSGTDDVKTYEYVGGVWFENPYPTPVFYQCSSISLSKNDRYALIGSMNDYQLRLIEGVEFTIVKFNAAPNVGDVITADYTVDGVHKTDQYVIDTSFAIQFGEI